MLRSWRKLALGVCPSIRRHRVPSATGADARRREAGDVDGHRRGAPTPQMPPCRRNPRGAWVLPAISALPIVNDGQRCATKSPTRRCGLREKPRVRSVPRSRLKKSPSRPRAWAEEIRTDQGYFGRDRRGTPCMTERQGGPR